MAALIIIALFLFVCFIIFNLNKVTKEKDYWKDKYFENIILVPYGMKRYVNNSVIQRAMDCCGLNELRGVNTLNFTDLEFLNKPTLLCTSEKQISINNILNEYVNAKAIYEFNNAGGNDCTIWLVNNDQDKYPETGN